MPRGNKKLVAVVAVLVALTIAPATPASASSRLEETRRQIKATRSRLATALNTDAQILATLRAVTRQLNHESATLSGARSHLARLDLAVKSQERRLSELNKRRAQRGAIIAARARALYIMGPFDGTQALTMSGSFEDFVGRAGSLEYVMSFDRMVLEDLARIRHETRETELALRAQRRDAIERRNEIAQRVEIVSELASTKQEAHDKLSTSISSYRNQLAALQREQARIISIINSRTSHGTISGTPGRLGFAWPTRSRHINSAYGPRWGGFHTGIDIQCSQGVAFAASKSGRVIEAGYAGGYGKMTIVDHGGGYTSLYAHQSSLGVRRGQNVNRGQIIGRCGSTGNSTGAHMHFEIRYNGNHRNPRPFLP